MWIVCLADNSREMVSLIFSEKKKYFKMLSGLFVTSTLRVNLFKTTDP